MGALAEDMEIMREEAREEGLEEGRAEGRKEGRKEGLEEGRKEGRAEGRERVISEFVDYYCTPGAVVYSYNGCVWIKTKDNVI